MQTETIQIKKLKDVFQLIQQECVNRGYTYATIKTYICIARQFLECLHKKLAYIPKKSKLPQALPNILEREQILRMIDSVERTTRYYTLKHKLLIALPYDAGLRVSEAVSLKVTDIDLSKRQALIRAGKGNKDRIVIFGNKAAEMIREYLEKRNSSNPYLFDSGKNYHLSTKTAWIVLKRQAKECNIASECHPHILRASFATHLSDADTKEQDIQVLMGHSKRDTTYRYIRLSEARRRKIISPLDLDPKGSS